MRASTLKLVLSLPGPTAEALFDSVTCEARRCVIRAQKFFRKPMIHPGVPFSRKSLAASATSNFRVMDGDSPHAPQCQLCFFFGSVFNATIRYLLSRDYMTLRLWDCHMESAPVRTIHVHEQLRPRLCDL